MVVCKRCHLYGPPCMSVCVCENVHFLKTNTLLLNLNDMIWHTLSYICVCVCPWSKIRSKYIHTYGGVCVLVWDYGFSQGGRRVCVCSYILSQLCVFVLSSVERWPICSCCVCVFMLSSAERWPTWLCVCSCSVLVCLSPAGNECITGSFSNFYFEML